MSTDDQHHQGRVRDLVEARLGRRPQDRLEAAVVLEAWGGVRPPFALDAARDAVDASGERPTRSLASPRATRPRDRTVIAEGLSLLIAVVAVAMWTQPFGDALGAGVWDSAIRTALPITLAAQWMMRSRYLGRPNGLEALRRDWLGLVAVLSFGVTFALAQGEQEQVTCLLALTWISGTVLVRRGWALAYVSVLVAVAVAANLDVDPLRLLTGAMLATSLLTLVAVVGAGPTSEPAGRWSRALSAGVLGGGLGGLLVLDTSIGWGSEGVLPALALVPSTLGSFWGGYYLWRFYDEVPRALLGVPVAQADRATLRSPAMAVLGGAFGRLMVATLALSAAALIVAPYVSDTPTARGSEAPGVVQTQAFGMPDRLAPLSTPALPALSDPVNRADAQPSSVALAALPGLEARPLYTLTPSGPEERAGRIVLLAGFGLIALATLLISLLQSLGFPSWAGFTLVCAIGAELAVIQLDVASFQGAGLLAGAAVATLVAIPPVISLFRRPGRVLATTLWIN